MTYQAEEAALAADEEGKIAVIRGPYDAMKVAVIPHLATLLIFATGFIAGDLLSGTWMWGALGGFMALFFQFWLVSSVPQGKKYEARVTVPLWYAFMAWGILAAAPLLLVWIATTGHQRILAILTNAVIFFAVYARRKVRGGVRSVPSLSLGFLHEVREVVVFCQNILSRLASRSLWWIKTGITALIMAAGKGQSALSSDSRQGQFGRFSAHDPQDHALTILHLSDLHLRPNGQPAIENGLLWEPIKIDEFRRFVTEAPKFSLIVITGDITDTGSAKEYAEAESFLTEMRTIVGDTPIILVPGNHDVGVNQCCWSIEGQLHPWLRTGITLLGAATNPFKNTYKVRLGRFNKLSAEATHPQTASTSRLNLLNFPDYDLSVVTLNTTLPSSWIFSNAGGHFGRNDVDDLEALSPRFKSRLLILCHHHVQSADEKDPFLDGVDPFKAAGMRASTSLLLADSLIERLGRTSRDTLILHGHTHIRRLYGLRPTSEKSPHTIPVRCAPSLLGNKSAGFLVHRWPVEKDILSALVEWDPVQRKYS